MSRKRENKLVPMTKKQETQMYKMKAFLLNIDTLKPARKLYAVFIAIGLGLLIGLIPIEGAGGDSVYAYELMFTNFQKGKVIENKMLNLLATYGLLSLGTAIAFKAGVLNIGATGQFMTGGFLVLILGIAKGNDFTTAEAIPVMLILSAAGGAAVAVLAALLKVLFRINEVVSTLLLNWVVFYIFKIALFDLPNYRDDIHGGGSLSIAESFTFKVGDSTYLLPLIIFLVLVVVIWVILTFTTFGFKIKACGRNFTAARANGISVNRIFISTFAISGALCGLAGAFFYIYRQRVNLGSDILPVEGFNAIAISLLAFNEPFGVIFTSLFYSIIETGKPAANAANIDPQAMSLVISIIIFFSALAAIFIKARPLKWIIEQVVYATHKETQRLQTELENLEKSTKNSTILKKANQDLKELDKKMIAMKLDVNELGRAKFVMKKLSHQKKLEQIQNNAEILLKYMKQINWEKNQFGEKPILDWSREERVTIQSDIHPMLQKRRELNQIIASFEIPLENKKAELKRQKRFIIKEWYSNLGTFALFFMKVVA